MPGQIQPPDGDFAAIARPVRDALVHAGITTLEQVARTTPRELLKLHGIGPKGIRQLREALAARGLGFADD